MKWHRWLATLLVMLALAACAQAVTGQGQAPYPNWSSIGPEE
jgi:ABC-type glycerol-3-phosphate transport system substrate-binding protein